MSHLTYGQLARLSADELFALLDAKRKRHCAKQRHYDARRRRRVCRHCGTARVNRPRGLCWACHNDPAIRALYPSSANHGGVGNDCRGLTPPPEPTTAEPGTEAKMVVLCERAALGQQLWHRGDPCLDHAVDLGDRMAGRVRSVHVPAGVA